MNRAPALLAFLAALVTGCAMFEAKSPPLVAPKLETSVAYFAGSSLSGPIGTAPARPIDNDPSGAIACTCRVAYVERFDETWLAPLSSRSRLVMTSTAGEPFQATSQLAPRARLGSGEAARDFLLALDDARDPRSVAVAVQDAVLPRGVTVVFSCAAAPVTLEDGRIAERSADVEVSRGDDANGALQVALVLEGPIVVRGEDDTLDDAKPAPKVARSAAREAILLEDEPQIGGSPLVLVFPSNFDEAGAFVVVIGASGAPADEPAAQEHEARVASALAQIGDVGQSTRERARELGRREAWSREVGNVLRALEDPARRRAALVFLASSTGAALVEDAAYSARDAELAELARIAGEVTGETAALETSSDQSGFERELGWALESRVWAHFARLVADEKLAPELDAVLLRHCGECGRWPDTIVEGVRRSRDAEALRAHFVRENRIFLEDSAPGSRVRACDWLLARGLAPAGFDPLAPEAERRRVILALENEAEAAAASAGKGEQK